MALFSALIADTLHTLDIDPAGGADELALAALVGRGLPVHSVEALLELGIPEADIFRLVLSRRTYQRRHAAHSALTADESDRAERLARIVALTCAVLGDAKRAVNWLTTAKRGFDNRRALDLLGSNIGAKIVEEALLQAYYGNVA